MKKKTEKDNKQKETMEKWRLMGLRKGVEVHESHECHIRVVTNDYFPSSSGVSMQSAYLLVFIYNVPQ